VADDDAATPGASDCGEAAAATLAALQTGDPVARLEIPKIGVDYIVLEGVDLGTLESGPGHFPETPLPGQPGNSAIAGHRATYDAPFNLLNEMVPGDEVVVTTVQGEFRYEVLPNAGAPEDPPGSVYGYRIVSPTALEILDDKGDDRITLMGCHPRYGSSSRIVVEARLVTDSAPATPPPPTAAAASDGTELLRGESGGWGPVLLWSGAVIVVCALVLLAAHQWRRWRWAFYLLALAPVGLLLFRSFEAVTNLSPVAY
jgi:sortase A